MTREQVIIRLVKEGMGLPMAIATYNILSCNGFYEVDKKDLNEYIRKNL